MSIQIIGSSGNILNTDASNNVLVSEGLETYEGGGHFTLSGGPAAIVAAALATNVTLAYFYFLSSNKVAYVKRFRLIVGAATIGATGGVGGILGLQRFENLGLYPTAIPNQNRQNEESNRSEMISAASNAAITMTNAVFGDEVAWTRVPVFISTDALKMEWIYEPSYPTVLRVNQGLALRTRVAMAATQTWVYSYTLHFKEL